jgi:hypothetical protein
VRSGTVAFSADGNVIPNCSSVAITRGVAACGAAALALGAHNVTAAYSSSGVYLASSASTHQTVLAAASADLGIQMLGSPFLLRITNAGPTAASSVVVTDALPAGTVFKSSLAFGAACTGPGSGNNGTVTCTAKSLPTSGEIWIFVNVGFTSPQGATITNTATVSAATSDPNAANNSASASLQVPAAGTIAAARPAPASPASN